MQTAIMQSGYSSTDQAAQVIAMSPRRDNKPEVLPFINNSDHLQALENEAKLMVAVASIRHGRVIREDLTDLASRFPFLPLGADLRLAKSVLEEVAGLNRQREELSRQNGMNLHFVDFCDKWTLDSVERKIVQLLLLQFSSPSFYATYELSRFERNCDNGMEIGALLSIISDGLSDQLEYQRYFSIQSNLLHNELLIGNFNHMDNTTSILRMSVYLHERYVRHILGDVNQYHVAFRFIKHEMSTVSLEQIVLPENIKDDVVMHVERYLAGRKNGSFDQLDDFFGYGTGLALLFHGPSGTGKTMLARGLANHLSCPLVSFNLEDRGKIPLSDDEILAMLFREAALLGGIVFLDECDDIFSQSNDKALSRSLLIEIEKSRCITILATNKPLELDPAMERRIGMKVHFRLPDAEQRLDMWHALLPPATALASCVNLELLAERFHFTGGLIKNSILMALTASRSSDGSPAEITHEALMHSATLQTATMSDISRICEIIKPCSSLDSLPLNRHQRDQMRGLGKAWEWLSQEGTGFNLLFSCNDISTGVKTVCGLAAELGMTVRSFDFSQVSSVLEDNKVMDIVTQRRVYPMIAAFSIAASDQSLTLFIDYTGEVGRLIDTDPDKISNIMYSEMFNQLRQNKGLFCLVTKEMKSRHVPIEFHQTISLSFPPEELQMQHWEKNLGKAAVSDDSLVELVERFPMHISEIEFIARQAKVRAIMSDRTVPTIDDVNQVITGYRGFKKAGVLFGSDA